MDCCYTHYYRLNRKLLLIVGQWPYQRYSDRIKIWILYLCVFGFATTTQVAKAITTAIDFNSFIEFFSIWLTTLLILVRYFVYSINSDKARALIDNMKLNWQSLVDEDEYEILGKVAERGRLYVLRYIMFIYSIIICQCIVTFSPPLLNYTNLINSTFPRIVLYPAKYFIDEQKYYYLILAHMYLTDIVYFTAVLASDTFCIVLMYHAIGMFKIACHRLEHAFDNCNGKIRHASGRTNVCEKIANAVECHRQATRFCNTLSAMYDWANLISLAIVLINITVSLYWAVSSKGQGFKPIFGMMLAIGQIAHVLTFEVPAQWITDNSGDVIYKAYSSMWYMAPVKEQALVLLTMQRGLRPNAIMVGNMYPMSLESYATEIKVSFSYFTVLMSMK